MPNSKLQTANAKSAGFTLVELVIVIVVLGILSVVALPRFLDISTSAKIATLEGLKAQMQSAVTLVQAKARLANLRPLATNPNALQSELIVDFGFGKTEVMFANLCPESDGELGDAFDAVDFLDYDSDELETRITNVYTLIGYEVPATGTPKDQGCYMLYDSFATPNCTIELITADC